MRIRAIDLFCGGGGSSWGARAAGVEMVGAVDAWDIATATYRDNFPAAEIVTARLDGYSGAELFQTVSDVDLLIASPECTHHSIARGAKPRDEESRRSGWYIMPFVQAYEPRWIVLENVTGMRRWPGYDELMEELGRIYHLRTQVIDAADFGVPQTRRRLFIVGDRTRKPPKILAPAGGQKPVSSILAPAGTWKAAPVYNGKRAANTVERIERGIAELGKNVDFISVYYGSDRAGGWQQLERPLRTMTTLDRFGLVQWVEGQPMLRMLQVPELRRAMGFDDEFQLLRGTRRDKVKLLGNGVCPPVMRAVIETLTGTRDARGDRTGQAAGDSIAIAA